MNPISILIVEDEILIAETIRMYLNERGHSVTEIAISYEEAVSSYETVRPDVILLDVRLYGEKSGIDFANYLTSSKSKVPFVFLTSQFDKRIVQEAMLSKPYGYLTKPIQKETLWTTVELAEYQAKGENNVEKLHINDGTESHIIDPKDILYISSEHVYIKIFTLDNKSLLVRKSLSQIMDELDEDYFIQCHRGYIINLQHVNSYNTNHVVIHNKEIPLSRSRKYEVQNKLKNLSF